MPQAIFAYHLGMDAEQYAFFRIPKLLITDPYFRRLSTDAKLLYGLMLDRMSLSMRNGWMDDDGHVYIYFTLEEACEQLCCKTDFLKFYESTGMRYVSTHPMFGPTFANLGALSSENAIVIKEGDYMGRIFFLDLYRRLGLHVHEYTFEEHDEAMAYSLSVPFVSTFVFSAVMKHQDAPGTTFKRHLKIARGVLSEDNTLLREILFNPRTKSHVEQIRAELKELINIIDNRDEAGLNDYLTRIRTNIS